MVFIISESSDRSTNKVIEWIVKFDYPFIRINPEDTIEIIELGLLDFKLLINNTQIICYSDITSIWFRRGFLNIKKDAITSKDGFVSYMHHHLRQENEAYIEYIYYLLSLKRHIGADDKIHINKFIVLKTALDCRMNIPESFCISDKKRLLHFLEQKGELITKSSNYIFNFSAGDESYMTYTEQINDSIIEKTPNNFFLSFCQTLIKKHCDIRVFYLNKRCYAMAILSQDNSETKVDFRKYNYESPNRWVPIELPNTLQFKIINLMTGLNLISGSLDFILNEDGEYIFLEVNPIGQFGMVDLPCNYSLNKHIAKYLIFGEQENLS